MGLLNDTGKQSGDFLYWSNLFKAQRKSAAASSRQLLLPQPNSADEGTWTGCSSQPCSSPLFTTLAIKKSQENSFPRGPVGGKALANTGKRRKEFISDFDNLSSKWNRRAFSHIAVVLKERETELFLYSEQQSHPRQAGIFTLSELTTPRLKKRAHLSYVLFFPFVTRDYRTPESSQLGPKMFHSINWLLLASFSIGIKTCKWWRSTHLWAWCSVWGPTVFSRGPPVSSRA